MKKQLERLRLKWILDNYQQELADAARLGRSPEQLLERLLNGECEAKENNAIKRRLRAARLPAVRTLEQFDWNWPEKINRDHIQHLFTLSFMRQNANVVFIGNVGLGKTHFALALARKACLANHSVLFTSAVSIINTLCEAQQNGALTRTLNRYVRPQLLVIDELGYLPVDRKGAQLLFEVLTQRYEQASTIITTNREYKKWPLIFANDAMLASAVADRVVHHSETVIIKGKSYRAKDRIEALS